jgi:hypothetical protein
VSVVVSLFALGFAFVSLILALRADRRASRAERGARRGRPVVVPNGGSGGPGAFSVSHNYVVANGGNAVITELALWIVDRGGDVVSTRAGGPVVLAPGGPPVHMTVEVSAPLPEEQELMVQWRDADGQHTESSGIQPPRHM